VRSINANHNLWFKRPYCSSKDGPSNCAQHQRINANHNLWFKRPYCSSKDGPSHCAQHQRQLQPNTASGYPFSQEIPLGISADTSQQPCLSLWFTTTGCKTIPAKTALIVRSINANYNPTLHQATPFRRTSLSAFLLIRHSSLVSAFDSPPPDVKGQTIPAKTAPLIVRSINANYKPTLHQATPFRRKSLSAFLLTRHSSLISAFDSPPPDVKGQTIPAKTAPLIVRSINANYNPTLHQATPFRRKSLSAFLLIRHSSLVSAFDSPPPDLKLFQQRRLSLCAASTPTTTQHCIRPPLFAGSPCLHFC